LNNGFSYDRQNGAPFAEAFSNTYSNEQMLSAFFIFIGAFAFDGNGAAKRYAY
jgi:hypothetical protein